MYKRGFEEAEESEIKLPTFAGSWRKQGSSSGASTSASLTTLNPLSVWITTNCGKLSKRWDYQTTLPVSWETCMQVKRQHRHKQRTGSKLEEALCDTLCQDSLWQGSTVSLCLFNLYAEYIVWNARLDKSRAGIKIAGRNINNFRYGDDTTLMAESKEDLKSLLMRVKEESEKVACYSTFKKVRLSHSVSLFHGKQKRKK